MFTFAATTAVAALAEPDVSNPPSSVLTSVLSGVDPHAPVDFPDGGLEGIAHAPHTLATGSSANSALLLSAVLPFIGP